MAPIAETGDRKSVDYAEIALRVVKEIGVITPDHRRAMFGKLLQTGNSILIDHARTNLEQLRTELINNIPKLQETHRQLELGVQNLMEKLERLEGEAFELDLSFLRDSSLNEARLQIASATNKVIKNIGRERSVNKNEVDSALYKAMCYTE